MKYANEGGGGEVTAFLHLHPVTAVGGGGRRGTGSEKKIARHRETPKEEEFWKTRRLQTGGRLEEDERRDRWPEKISERHLATSF